jgi:hypothetical protein
MSMLTSSALSGAVSDAQEEHIGSVNVWELHQFNWPILRVFARHSVDHLELARYLRGLLATGRWDLVRAIPVDTVDGHPSDHVFEIYGHPRQPVM